MNQQEYNDYLAIIKEADDRGLLDKSEEDKYSEYKSKDPFPEIQPALLNSADILKYVLLTGLISDFKCEDLIGATYSCRVSGEYLKFNNNKQMCCEPENDENDIIIEPNSITYVAVKNMFRVPDYMALRFNLRVSHAYKGLLLGTGPIIDPGFVGQIYIPLHNLTSNTYYIKPGAQLISVEFTKLSPHLSWVGDTSHDKGLIKGINSVDYIHKRIIPNRPLFDYIDRALTEKDFYRDRSLPKSISSAVTDEMQSISAKLSGYQKNLDMCVENMEGKIEQFNMEITSEKEKIGEALKRATSSENFIKGFSIFAIISILVSCISFGWNAYSFGRDSSALRDATSAIELQREEYEEMKLFYDISIEELLDRIEALEAEISKGEQ